MLTIWAALWKLCVCVWRHWGYIHQEGTETSSDHQIENSASNSKTEWKAVALDVIVVHPEQRLLLNLNNNWCLFLHSDSFISKPLINKIHHNSFLSSPFNNSPWVLELLIHFFNDLANTWIPLQGTQMFEQANCRFLGINTPIWTLLYASTLCDYISKFPNKWIIFGFLSIWPNKLRHILLTNQKKTYNNPIGSQYT